MTTDVSDVPAVLPPAPSTAVPPERPRAGHSRVGRERLRLIARSWTFWVGAVMLLAWIACAVVCDVVRPYDPLAQDLLQMSLPPSAAHPFGTDNLGRDVLSRVLVGARNAMIVPPLAAVLGTVLGTVVGLVQGYLRGVVDAVVGRVVEAFLAVPVVIITFLFVVALGPSDVTLVVVIGVAFGLVVSRTVRAAVMAERELDYVAAASLRGESALRTMVAEILPNVVSPVVVEFTVRLGYAITAVSTLSFLGVGIQPPTPDWGADIAANAQYLAAGYWWQTLFPALAIMSLITAVNLVGDSIETVVDQ